MTPRRTHATPEILTDGRRDEATGVDDAASARVARQYRETVEAGDPLALAELYSSDALLDYHVPGWRFQVQGREAVARQVCVLPRPGRFTTFDAEPIPGGLLVQFAWQQDDAAGGAVVRQLQRWRLADGRLAGQLAFCAGVWSRQLQERMALEAPLVRP